MKIPHRDRYCRWRIGHADRAQVEELITAGWDEGVSVDHSFATAWDAGIMLASRRSWWRIASEMDQRPRPVIARRGGPRAPRPVPVVAASMPGQAWSWDITDLPSKWRGVNFKAYKITDIYSRQIVGHRVEHRESEHLAEEMFAQAMGAHGVPEVVHADSGSAMVSKTLARLLGDCEVRLSFNRPYVSNDNPFSEAGFKTMKYRPGYPGQFESLEAARDHLEEYVGWYNSTHRHSGIALLTPDEVADGSWKQTWQRRDQALQAYYQRHPDRFYQRPKTPQPAELVGINLEPGSEPEATT